MAPVETEASEIENLIENDHTENLEDTVAIKNIKSPLKVADDELIDTDDDG